MWKPIEVEDERAAALWATTPLSAPFGGAAKPTRRCAKLKCRLVLCCILSLTMGVLVVALGKASATDPELEKGPCVSYCPKCKKKGLHHPPSSPLPSPDLAQKTDPWFITTNTRSQPIHYDEKEDALRVEYKPNKFGRVSGAEFRGNPHNLLPAESAVLSYQVYFPSDFDWHRGGKLPGFCISDAPRTCATGSNWAWGAGSLRMMWREGGRAIGYVYVPLAAGFLGARWSAWWAQGSGYKRVASDTGNTGDDVWCKEDGGLLLKAGQWNDVSMLVAMSTPGFANGWISVSVNGQTRTVKDVRWRGLTRNIKVSSVLFATFFGGGDATWATQQKGAHALFRNFTFSAPADLHASNI